MRSSVQYIPQHASVREMNDIIRQNTYHSLAYAMSVLTFVALLFGVLASLKKPSFNPEKLIPTVVVSTYQFSENKPAKGTNRTEKPVNKPATKNIRNHSVAKPSDYAPVEKITETKNVDTTQSAVSQGSHQGTSDIVDSGTIGTGSPNAPNNGTTGTGGSQTNLSDFVDDGDFQSVEQEPTVSMNDLLRNIEYPDMARRAGIEGQVLLMVLVGPEGQVIRHKLLQSENVMLNPAAIAAVTRTRFTPAMQNGTSVACWVTVPITFRLR